MNLLWMYTRASITRNAYRTLAMVLGTMLAIGLLSAVLFYVDSSAAQMTQKALATVPVDMQVVANSADANLAAVEPALTSQPDVTGAARFSIASFASGQISGDSSLATATTPGALIAVEPNYFSLFSLPRVIEGQFSADGLLISKDMATNPRRAPRRHDHAAFRRVRSRLTQHRLAGSSICQGRICCSPRPIRSAARWRSIHRRMSS